MRFSEVSYAHDGTALTGLLVRPESAARGAVAVFPTIANCTPIIEEKAQALAQRGYIAMICDFYGRQPMGMEQAFKWADELRKNAAHYRARVKAGLEALRGEVSQDLPMGAIGFCMGGQAVLEMARAGEDLFAVTSFHGLLDTQLYARPGSITARILVCHGDADPLVPRSDVMAFWEEMDAAKADWHFHSYASVKHGFTNPHNPAGSAAVDYDASADRQSWTAMLSMFDECLG
jgi:dienelactone hydrolase